MKYDAKIAEKIKLKASSFYASSRMWNDGIIPLHQTRKVSPRKKKPCFTVEPSRVGDREIFSFWWQK